MVYARDDFDAPAEMSRYEMPRSDDAREDAKDD